MQRISIDLLPLEFREKDLKNARFLKIQTIGLTAVLITIFLASLTVALAILQSQQISQIQQKLTQNEQKISDLKTTQASLLLLKNRLTAINQYLGTPSKQAQMYKLINDLLPSSVSVSSLSVDKSGEVLVLAAASNSVALDNLINSLTSPETNQDKIQKVNIENLSRGRDGIYRISFKVKPK